MGKRRLRLLKQIDPAFEIIGVDSSKERCDAAKEEYGINTYSSIQEAWSKEHPEAAVVSTSPISHAAIINELLNLSANVFTEINLIADGYDENIKLSKENNCVLFLSSTFLYRNDIRYIINAVSGKKVGYRYHVGQYLPDWHPWESFKNFFVSNKRTNGCREIFAIDFPWLVEAFGEIKDVKVMKQTISGLELGYPDTYQLIIEHENGTIGAVSIDIVSRKAGRSLEVYDEEMHLFWEGTPQTLSKYDLATKKVENIATYENAVEHDSNYSNASIIEDAYRAELEAFLEEVRTGSTEKTKYSFEKDKELLKWLDFIEK